MKMDLYINLHINLYEKNVEQIKFLVFCNIVSLHRPLSNKISKDYQIVIIYQKHRKIVAYLNCAWKTARLYSSSKLYEQGFYWISLFICLSISHIPHDVIHQIEPSESEKMLYWYAQSRQTDKVCKFLLKIIQI